MSIGAIASKCTLATPSGSLFGSYEASRNLCAYRRVPYAKPPVGDLRWRAPVPAGTWEGELNATSFSPLCMQDSYGAWATVEMKDSVSEDCLYLNVVAPPPDEIDAARPLPVVVYFHAGEFSYGGASDAESDWPWADDIILVTPNSRLGILGYLGSADLRDRTDDGATGSYGIQDQRESLRWVAANIGSFGGNASDVAIMGESSGGSSVGVHLTSEASWGLFTKVLAESPGLTQVKTLADAELNYDYVLASLLAVDSPGCVRAQGERAQGERAAGAGALGGAYATFAHTMVPLSAGPGKSSVIGVKNGWGYAEAAAACEELPDCRGFDVFVTVYLNSTVESTVYLVNSSSLYDTTTHDSLPANQSVTAYLKAGARGAQGVDCLVNADARLFPALGNAPPRADTFETDAFAPVVDGIGLKLGIIPAIVANKVAPGVALLTGSNMDEGTIFMYLTPKLKCNATADDLLAWSTSFYGPDLGAKVPGAYANLRQPVPNCTTPGMPPEAHYMKAMRSAGDYAITCAARDAAQRLQSRGHRVFTYYFTHQPETSANYHNLPTLGAFHGAEVPFVFNASFELQSEGERTLAAQMGCYWRNFVWTGDPSVPPAGRNDPCAGMALPTWPSFVGGDDEMTMVLDVGAVAAEAGLKSAQCDMFLKTGAAERDD